jgi:hypothetical protein
MRVAKMVKTLWWIAAIFGALGVFGAFVPGSGYGEDLGPPSLLLPTVFGLMALGCAGAAVILGRQHRS